jgi:hypothetical protein
MDVSPEARNWPGERYYLWQAGGIAGAIHLSLAVAGRLQKHAKQGFKAVPRRGLEVGGLLLGRIEPGPDGAIVVEDFEPVPSEHKRGPSYTLSFKDLDDLKACVERERDIEVVGFYRSHTRAGLYLDESDYAVVSDYFPGARQIVLLVRPSQGETVAGFFFRKAGGMDRKASALEFPLDPVALTSGAYPIVQGVSAVPPRRLPEAPPPPPRSFEPGFPWRSLQGGWALGSSLALLALAALGAAYWPRSETGQAPERAPVSLALNVERQAGQLRLSWDRDSPVVHTADRGLLGITDGDKRAEVNLDETELRTGSFVYWPVSRDVNFRLEVFDGTIRFAESVRTLVGPSVAPAPSFSASGAAPGELPEPSRFRPAANPRTGQEALKRADTLAPPVRKAERKPFTTWASRSARETAVREIEPPPVLSPSALSRPASPGSALNAVATPRLPMALVSYEPVTTSKFRRVIRKIPGLGALAGKGRREREEFVPARPIHQVRPVTPPKILRELDEEVPVELRVFIDETGRVSRTDYLAEQETELARLARTAAHLWKFEPARLRDEAVSSEMILRFRFGAEAKNR